MTDKPCVIPAVKITYGKRKSKKEKIDTDKNIIASGDIEIK